jgi:hypothetical protein
MARNGYESQQTNVPEDPARPDNLWDPVPGDHGAHGDFDRRAHSFSYQLWATTHRTWLTLGGLTLAGLACAALFGNGTLSRANGRNRLSAEAKCRRRILE